MNIGNLFLVSLVTFTGPIIGMLLTHFVIRQFQKRKNRREMLQHQKALDKKVKEMHEAHDKWVVALKTRTHPSLDEFNTKTIAEEWNKLI